MKKKTNSTIKHELFRMNVVTSRHFSSQRFRLTSNRFIPEPSEKSTGAYFPKNNVATKLLTRDILCNRKHESFKLFYASCTSLNCNAFSFTSVLSYAILFVSAILAICGPENLSQAVEPVILANSCATRYDITRLCVERIEHEIYFRKPTTAPPTAFSNFLQYSLVLESIQMGELGTVKLVAN